ncbi:MAG: arginine deiminase [Rhodothermales bacterium]|nr:arginine deiminase [Rhodothermales bacterium]
MNQVYSELLPSITSESNLLKKVVVHTPGSEMGLVSPANREDLLFEDILFLEKAQEEHRLMCSIFEKIIGGKDGVVQLSDLLSHALSIDDARIEFIDALCSGDRGGSVSAFRDELGDFSPAELQKFAMTGKSDLPIELSPLPNLMFTRDLAATVGDHIVLARPATAARWREAIIMSTALRYHPDLADKPERFIQLPEGVTFEGGDLLVVNDKIVMIGNSQRTSFGGIVNTAQQLLARTSIEHVILVSIPKKRSYMHLDTVLTFSSPHECVVFPPLFDSGIQGTVVGFSSLGNGDLKASLFGNILEALQELYHRDIEFIPCGGNNPLDQQREQWTDGSNFFAVSPGVVVGYERNEKTFDVMSQRGYRVVSADGFLSFYGQSNFSSGDKIAIKLEGNELSRGRGGPRCMTMPIARTLS